MPLELYKYYQHEGLPEWGVGRVLEIEEQFINILFTKAGLKSLKRDVAEQMLKKHSGNIDSSELSLDPRLIEPEGLLQQRLDSEVLQGKLPSSPPEADPLLEEDLPVAGTGRKAPDYLRNFQRKNGRS